MPCTREYIGVGLELAEGGVAMEHVVGAESHLAVRPSSWMETCDCRLSAVRGICLRTPIARLGGERPRREKPADEDVPGYLFRLIQLDPPTEIFRSLGNLVDAGVSRLLLGCLVLQRWEEVAGHLEEAIRLAAKPNARMGVYVTSLHEILRDRQQPPHVLQHGLEHGLAITACGPGLVRVRVAHHDGRVSVQHARTASPTFSATTT